MDSKKTPNTLLRYERRIRGWSQQKIAEILGTSEDVISRWERGERTPSPHYQEKLCQLFGKLANELGLMESEHTVESDKRCFESHLVNQREIIATQPNKILVGTQTYTNQDIKTSIPFVELQDISVSPPPLIALDFGILDRLERAFTPRLQIDPATFDYLQVVTSELKKQLVQGKQTNWAGLLITALNQLGIYTNLLESNTEKTDQLIAFLGENCLLVGDVLFNMRDFERAKRYYEMALRAAREARNVVLQAIAAGRYSLLLIDSHQYVQARQLLEEILRVSEQNISSVVCSWLWAVKAEVYANEGEEKRCYDALEAARVHLSLNKQRSDCYTFTPELVPSVYGTTKLLGFEGACYLQLKQPEQAQRVLATSLNLSSHPHHQSLIHIDFARSFVQQNSPEEACAFASKAIATVQQTGSARAFQRIVSIRQSLHPWDGLPEVRKLDERITLFTKEGA